MVIFSSFFDTCFIRFQRLLRPIAKETKVGQSSGRRHMSHWHLKVSAVLFFVYHCVSIHSRLIIAFGKSELAGEFSGLNFVLPMYMPVLRYIYPFLMSVFTE